MLVEQNTARALRLADEIRLMSAGRVPLTEPAAEVELEQLHGLYFAREAG